MKKLLAIICAGIMSLSMAACQSVPTSENSEQDNSAVTETTNDVQSEQETADTETNEQETQQTQSDAQTEENEEETAE